MPTRTRVVILQHPQEPDKVLGSARLAQLSLKNSDLRIGLSWPNLKKAVEDPEAVPAQWAVLYLGSGIRDAESPKPGLHFVDKKGALIPKTEIRGLIVLDGTWSQAKALWWRNAWLLKLKRVILTPSRKSLYGALRREPRRECLSTIEAIAESLTYLGEEPSIAENLRGTFGALLERARGGNKPTTA